MTTLESFAKIIAGQEAFEAETASMEQHTKPGDLRGTRESESLCRWQLTIGGRWKSVELVNSISGWTVRATSGTDNFALLAGPRYRNVDGTYESALAWAERWVAKEPAHRYAYMRNFEFSKESVPA